MSNSNIDEILDELVFQCESNRDMGTSNWENYIHGEIKPKAKQAIQQELLKARIDELEKLIKVHGNIIYKENITGIIAGLQAKLKENSDG